MPPPLKRIRTTEPQAEAPAGIPASAPQRSEALPAWPAATDDLARRVPPAPMLPPPRQQLPRFQASTQAATAGTPWTPTPWDGRGPAPGLGALLSGMSSTAQPAAAESSSASHQSAAAELAAIRHASVRTPRGRNVSEQGRQRIRDLWQQEPRPKVEDICSDYGLTPGQVDYALYRRGLVAPESRSSRVRPVATTEPLPPGMKSASGRLTSDGQVEVLRRYRLDPGKSATALGREMTVSHLTVSILLKRTELADAVPPKQLVPDEAASRRPVAHVADWNEVVMTRGWNAGDQFSMQMADGLPGLFQVNRTRYPKELVRADDFSLLLRGG